MNIFCLIFGHKSKISFTSEILPIAVCTRCGKVSSCTEKQLAEIDEMSLDEVEKKFDIHIPPQPLINIQEELERQKNPHPDCGNMVEVKPKVMMGYLTLHECDKCGERMYL